jgi:hypothetical protein
MWLLPAFKEKGKGGEDTHTHTHTHTSCLLAKLSTCEQWPLAFTPLNKSPLRMAFLKFRKNQWATCQPNVCQVVMSETINKLQFPRTYAGKNFPPPSRPSNSLIIRPARVKTKTLNVGLERLTDYQKRSGCNKKKRVLGALERRVRMRTREIA